MLSLAAHGYRVQLDPRRGATLLSAEWCAPTGDWLPILAPLADPGAGLTAGCFVMAPFANRIAAGRFSFAGAVHQLPLNRPQEGMAIHGFSRDHGFDVLSQGVDHATLTQDFAVDGLPWHYELRYDIQLSTKGLCLTLTLTHRGAAPMPYGLGLHPWFPKPAGTTLSFAARGAHQRDALGLPLAETAPQPAFAAAAPQPLDHLPWFDGCFSDWSPRRARICWPDRKAALDLAGEGAFRHLHVYVPDDRAVLCAEPVSHLPDAVNRPDQGPTAQMTLLARGQSLSGSLILSALPLCPQPSPSLPQEVPA